MDCLNSIYQQGLYPIIVITQSLDVGMSVGWAMPASTYLTQEHPRRVVGGDPTEMVPGFEPHIMTWVFSVQTLTIAATSVFSNYLKSFSPKTKILFFGFFKLLFWGILLFADTTPFWTILSRVLLGFGQILFASIPLYIEEITESNYRGFFIAFCDSSANMGILFAFVLGSTLSFSLDLWILFCFSLTSWLACLFLPESPIWLKAKGDDEKALESLVRVRHKKHDFISELNNIDKYLDTRLEKDTTFLQLLNFLKTQRHYSHSLCLVLCLFLFQQLSGISLIVSYLITIIDEDSPLDKYTATIILGCGCSLGSLLASCFSDRCGRRPLLLASEGVVAICLAFFALYSAKILDYYLIPIIAGTVHTLMMNLGLGPLPFVIMTELLPCQIRSWGSYLGMVIFGLTCFTVTKTFYSLSDAIGIGCVFGVYSIINVIGLIIIWKFLPETKSIPRHLMEQTIYFKTCDNDF